MTVSVPLGEVQTGPADDRVFVVDAIDHDLPYCEDFDVLAHELGHGTTSTEVGTPASPADRGTAEVGS